MKFFVVGETSGEVKLKTSLLQDSKAAESYTVRVAHVPYDSDICRVDRSLTLLWHSTCRTHYHRYITTIVGPSVISLSLY